jgi:hypothetical protein
MRMAFPALGENTVIVVVPSTTETGWTCKGRCWVCNDPFADTPTIASMVEPDGDRFEITPLCLSCLATARAGAGGDVLIVEVT